VVRSGSNALPVNGGQVRDTWFCPPGGWGVAGYDARQVDDLLCRVAAELDAGGSARPLVQNATLGYTGNGRRYDIDAVDRFLDRFLLPEGHFERGGIADDPWGDLPVARFAEGNAEEYNFCSRCENAWREGRAAHRGAADPSIRAGQLEEDLQRRREELHFAATVRIIFPGGR
jgi:hypothetical protein